jgi:GAF domain-containing protein
LREDDTFRRVASYNAPPKFAAFIANESLIHRRHSGSLNRLIETKQADHVADMAVNEPETPIVKFGGARTLLTVPMLKENELIGAIGIYRQEVRPFTNEQIELVNNFASQVVIAIENARLVSELRQRTDDLTETLDQQTATAEVLKVISRSAFDLQPVFDTMTEHAVKLCEAERAFIFRFDGKLLRAVATYNVGPKLREFADQNPIAPGRHSISARAALERRTVQVADIQADPEFSYATRDVELIRTILAVPMLKDDDLVGVITIYRLEIKPFTDKQVALVETFAAQAVIAIENTRLLNELRQRTDDLTESLQQQTATADVLKVISSSPGELQSVFSAMLENATRICEAKVGNLFLLEGDNFCAVAVHGDSHYADWSRQQPMVSLRDNPTTPLDRVVRTKQVVHISDLRLDRSYLDGNARIVSLVESAGARTHLVVPMLKEADLVGAIVIYRQEVRPFTDKQIALVQNFAAQAVIAIENARLLNELRQRTTDLTESLEQQTATSEVLRVISSSPGELKPVFQTMLENAVRICDAKFGVLYLYDGGKFRSTALANPSPEFEAFLKERGEFVPDPRTAPGRPDRTVTP